MAGNDILDLADNIVVVEIWNGEKQNTLMEWQKLKWKAAVRNIWIDCDKQQVWGDCKGWRKSV